MSATIHASAVLVGAGAVLMRGPGGAGKSRLAWELLRAGDRGLVPFTRLVADDRVRLQAAHGRLLARPAAELAGLIEIRGIGIRRLPYEPVAVIRVVVDLAAADAERLPNADRARAVIDGIALPRIAIPSGTEAFPVVLAALTTVDALSYEPVG